jgi:ClpP class serine protease
MRGVSVMEKDSTRIAVEKTLNMVKNTKELMKSRYKFGPNKVGMNKREVRRKIQSMSDSERQSFMKTIGPEQWGVMMEGLYSGTHSRT